MITRDKALELLHKNIESVNLRRHCLAVEAVMRALARYFKENQDEWGIAGLLHDADYELTKSTPEKHTHLTLEWLKDLDVTQDLKNAILAHGWGYVDGNEMPKTKFEWSIYCCDELTGFIVAVALTRPSKKLSDVTVESIKKKWGQKSFAGGVKREQIEECEARLGIRLPEFIEIALLAMQAVSEDLGL